ncbi:hypothetical protein [Roseivirga sp.]|uniref:capsular polysaccharide export protein, LipB/KpsS family n=1 Tax=Roseivirga sp. TaxID=1964215 RepID=UPI003B8CF423
MTICFVANFGKTYLFLEVARRLIKQGDFKVVWIVVNKKIKNDLLADELVNEADILFLPKNVPPAPEPAHIECKINEIVYHDRYLKFERASMKKYLHKVRDYTYDFLKKHDVRYVIGELTWGHELTINRVTRNAKELNCTYIRPHVTRMPDRHFAFYQGERDYLAYNPEQALVSDYKTIQVSKPTYFAKNTKNLSKSRSFGSRLMRLKRYITAERIDRHDPSVMYHWYRRFFKGYRDERNSIQYKFVKTETWEAVKDKKFVFYPLHMQPEASIDVLGQYYEEQIKNITNIWKILDEDSYLLVKEHPNAMGNRGFSFFKEIKALPNVLVVNEHIDSRKILDKAQAIFSVSSTAGYEAALLGKVSFTFSDVFFNHLKGCYRIGVDHFAQCKNFDDLIKSCREADKDKMNQEQFSQWLYTNAYAGTWNDEEEGAMKEENLNSLAYALTNYCKGR